MHTIELVFRTLGEFQFRDRTGGHEAINFGVLFARIDWLRNNEFHLSELNTRRHKK